MTSFADFVSEMNRDEIMLLRRLRLHEDSRDIAKLLSGILVRLLDARKKHPRYAENVWHGWGFVGEEYGEANKELTKAKPGWLDRAEEEMADLIVVTLRMMLREYQHEETPHAE